MATRKKKASDQEFLLRLGRRIELMILNERKYKSLDAFALEHHDQIAKPTLYQICDGERDMKISTLRAIARALEISLEDLVKEL